MLLPRFVKPLIASVVLVSACTQQAATPTPSSGSSASPYEVVVGIASEPSTLDPHQRNPPVEALVVNQIFDTLLVEDVNGKVGPGLATSWDFASDGLSVTLHLRQGVKFQDGTPFNADAVKFNYERQLDKNSEYYGDGTWKLVGTFAGNFALPVDVIDDHTVRLHLKSKVAPDITLADLANTPSAMVSPTAVKNERKNFTNKPVGTGPFKFVSWDKGQRIVLEKNPDYWGQKPAIDRLVLVPIADADARLNALRSGAIDINSDISADQLVAVKKLSDFTVLQKPTRHTWQILLNEKSVPQLKDKRVRQALNYAIDREAIVKDILGGSGVVAKGPMSAAFGNYTDTSLPGFPHDVAKAKQLLADAGFPNGQGIPQLTLMIPTDAALIGKPIPMGEAIQANLNDIGVKVTLAPSDFASWFAKVGKGDFQMAVFSLSYGLNDIDNALWQGYNSKNEPPALFNFGYYENPQVDQLTDATRTMTDRNQRIATAKQIQQIVAFDDPAAIFVEHALLSVAFAKKKVGSMEIGTHPAIIPFNLVKRP